MAIVPFILQGTNQTIVKDQGEWTLEGNVILMREIDENQMTKPDEPNTSYDLRVGEVYLDHRETRQMALTDGGIIKLPPGSAFIIETMEEVRFPKTRFGQIVPKVNLLKKGISNTTSKIDPGYNGKLLVTVFNLGKNTVPLKKGEKFCTMIVQTIHGSGVKHYNKPAQQIPSNPEGNLRGKIKDIITGPYMGFISIIVSALVAIGVAIYG
ncbi:hypothetical protein QNH16_24665 [Peribacillus frigoritolerans]|uniref:dCTP deaminase domain-containing protein n=1 Tax=Peribacillus frigoritolerans TaxID=450367 RepID=UPI0024BFDCAA|nr:hypothetical protein [Peribacillus frigoritolerans]WHY13871.1 hypothetical protein QNH16_24665 [Peribacillus frigoritolerans]